MYRNTFVFTSFNPYNTSGELNRASLSTNDKTWVERGEVTHPRSHSRKWQVSRSLITLSFLCAHICYTYTQHCKPTSMHIYPLAQAHKLTTSQPVVSRELESIFRAVPAFPSKLEFTLLNATLGTQGHTGSVGQIGLAKGKGP